MDPPLRFVILPPDILSVRLAAGLTPYVMMDRAAGRVFLYWFGSTPNICVADYAMAKQLLAERTGLFAKNHSNANILRLLGEGLVLANGDHWHRHKKVVHPAFNTDKLKVRSSQ